MNRNSKRAQALLATLDNAGVTLRGRTPTGRTLQSLDSQGMLPDAVPEGQLIAYFRLLGELGYGPGCDRGHIVRVMLTRGHPREPARDAIRRAMGSGGQSSGNEAPLSSQGLARLVAMSGMSTADVHQAGAEAWQQVPAASALIKRLSSMTVTGGRTDYAGAILGPLVETPPQRHGAIVNTFVQAVVGEDPDDLTPFADMAALFGAGRPGEELTSTEERDVLDGLRQVMRSGKKWDAILTTTPLDELAGAAARSRPSAEAFYAAAGLKLDDEALDDLAACFAPTTLLVERMVGERRDELPD